MASRIELSFLYQTRTILRLSKRRVTRRTFASSRESPDPSAQYGVHPLSLEEEPLPRAKAPGTSIPWSPLASKASAKDAGTGTTISSTITASERRAFETILRFAPKQDEHKAAKQRSPQLEAVDTDIDNILKIFTSSVQDYGSKENAVRGRKYPIGSLLFEDEDEGALPVRPVSTPHVRSVDESAAQEISLPERGSVPEAPADSSTSPSSTVGRQEGRQRVPHPEAEQSKSHSWSPFGQGPGQISLQDSSTIATEDVKFLRSEVLPEFPAPSAILDDVEASRQTGTREQHTIQAVEGITPGLAADTIEPVAAEFRETTSHEKTFEDAISSTTTTSFPAFSESNIVVSSAVRSKMQSISDLLEAAAASTAQRGDSAMWEVVESQIFSMAKHFQLRAASNQQKLEGRALSFGGIHKFVFTSQKSDEPREMIEAANREAWIKPVHAPVSAPTVRLPNGTVPAVDKINHTDLAATNLSPSSSISTPSPVLSTQDLKILQNVYPAALLLSLRLYITHFPTSPYPFLLLPRIRSLGTTSYVLGASPQFYNSLLSLVWMVRSSLREVDALLGEMERGGVEMDERTYTMLGGIEEEMNTDLGRKEGTKREGLMASQTSRSPGWWRRQEQMLFFPRVLDWLDVIAGRLAAKERLSVN